MTGKEGEGRIEKLGFHVELRKIKHLILSPQKQAKVVSCVQMDQHSRACSGDLKYDDVELKKHGKINGGMKAEKRRGSPVASRLQPSPPPSIACIKFWLVVVLTLLLLLWVIAIQAAILDDEGTFSRTFHYAFSPPPSEGECKNNGFLIVSANGGLNQRRLGISDMVAIAKYLNLTLMVPKFAYGTYWNDNGSFADIFDVDQFIASLRDEVHILKELPAELKEKVESGNLYSMLPNHFGTLNYYNDRILPRIQKHQVLHFAQTDGRLANNGLPNEIQKLRCRSNYKALRFTKPIQEVGQKIVSLLRQRGPFLVLHLRYEMDILAFTGCTEGLTGQEAIEMTRLRYSHEGWKHKPVDPKKTRARGTCPLTPEETALALQALGIDANTTIYIAAGDIYQKEKRMRALEAAYPNIVTKASLLNPIELVPFQNHSDQMAALDYIVALESDTFVPTFGGNMAKAVEGHRRYLGYRTTITLNRKLLFNLMDQYKDKKLSWDEFSLLVKKAHKDQMGQPAKRTELPGQPSAEDYFYSNPQECLSPFS